MVCVPAGNFEMGAAFAMVYGVPVDPPEVPAHPVTISVTFWLDETAVTAAAYGDCVDAGECMVPVAAQHPTLTYEVPGKENHPINGMNWYQAKQYCEWLGKRLPTEAEWEFAARGDDGRYFPWGNDVTTCSHVVAEGCGEPAGTGAVGSKPLGASPFGALNMADNVMEWCSDYYEAGYCPLALSLSSLPISISIPASSPPVQGGPSIHEPGRRGIFASRPRRTLAPQFQVGEPSVGAQIFRVKPPTS